MVGGIMLGKVITGGIITGTIIGDGVTTGDGMTTIGGVILGGVVIEVGVILGGVVIEVGVILGGVVNDEGVIGKLARKDGEPIKAEGEAIGDKLGGVITGRKIVLGDVDTSIELPTKNSVSATEVRLLLAMKPATSNLTRWLIGVGTMRPACLPIHTR